MKERDVIDKWCPMVRLSIQAKKDGVIESTPSFNRTNLNLLPLHTVELANATCLGSECAWWRNSKWNFLKYIPIIGFFYDKRGRCGVCQK